ncbi:uncharacterized protein LOC131156016 [Malania oleifera]|uniref:uncharacterized protein LOC131156016 n=1 Tax=Malania oleifera TaxID=397392 RepID=UPI0025AE0309|nr:uncharacterized protein LOC131156016 [Malania oleifera]
MLHYEEIPPPTIAAVGEAQSPSQSSEPPPASTDVPSIIEPAGPPTSLLATIKSLKVEQGQLASHVTAVLVLHVDIPVPLAPLHMITAHAPPRASALSAAPPLHTPPATPTLPQPSPTTSMPPFAPASPESPMVSGSFSYEGGSASSPRFDAAYQSDIITPYDKFSDLRGGNFNYDVGWSNEKD